MRGNLFSDFNNLKLDIGRVNYGIITLLPVVKEAHNIKQCRPICLLNVFYKIFTKDLMLRLDKVMGRIINRCQSGFLKDGNIMDGILTLHEILHDTRIKRKMVWFSNLTFRKLMTNWPKGLSPVGQSTLAALLRSGFHSPRPSHIQTTGGGGGHRPNYLGDGKPPSKGGVGVWGVFSAW